MTTLSDLYSARPYRRGQILISRNRTTMRMEYRAQLPCGRVVSVTSQRAAEMAINSVTK
jgi:hypothetical protein